MPASSFRPLLQLLVIFGLAIATASQAWADADIFLDESRALQGIEDQFDTPRSRQAKLLVSLEPSQASAKLKAPQTVNDALAILRQTPLSADALAIIASTGSATKFQRSLDQNGALLAASQVSRRASFARLIEIDAAIARRDLAAALMAIDHVLLTNPTLGSVIYPRLMLAINEPGGAAWIVSKWQRPWRPSFMAYSIKNMDSWEPLADIMLSTRHQNLAKDDILLPAMIKRMIDDGAIVQAMSFAQQYGDTEGKELGFFSISPGTLDQRLSPLVWTLSGDFQINASNPQNPIILFDIEPGQNVLLLHRYTMLKPGTYQFSHVMKNNSEPLPLTVQWIMTCTDLNMNNDWELAKIDLRIPVKFQSNFSIDRTCPVQFWQVFAKNNGIERPATLKSISINLKRL